MRMFDEFIGKKYGNLTITAFDHINPRKKPVFNCICDCGNKLQTSIIRLKKGLTKDCGCSKRNTDLTGKKFGRLLVVEKTDKRVKRHIVWKCQCDCGNTFYAEGRRLVAGESKSCGCIKKEKEHFACKLPIHKCWDTMISRCYNKKRESYNAYGGRGITVCDEWLGSNPKGFSNFYDWAMANGYSDEKLPNGRRKYTLDRIDNNKGYSPDNCRFVTDEVQMENKRDRLKVWYNGEFMLATKVAELNGIDKRLFSGRIRNGFSVEKALTKPRGKPTKKKAHKEGYVTRREAYKKYGITERQIRSILKLNKIDYVFEKNTYFFVEQQIKKLSEYCKTIPNKYYQKYKDFNP